MNDGHEYDANGWIVLRDENGTVRFHVHPNIFLALEQQARGKVPKLEVTKDEKGRHVISFAGMPITIADRTP